MPEVEDTWSSLVVGKGLTQKWQRCSIIVGENSGQLSLPFALWNRRAVMQLVKVVYA